MNKDARILVTLPSHPKTKKLDRRLGTAGKWSLVCLFLWAAQNKPDGSLHGMTDEDIELASDWDGELGIFVSALKEVGFLDGEPGHRTIHDWKEHNPWAAAATDRSESARYAALCKRHGAKTAAKMMPEYADRVRPACAPHTPRTDSECAPHAARVRLPENRSAPSPSPSPSPLPIPLPSPLPSPEPSPIVEMAYRSQNPQKVKPVAAGKPAASEENRATWDAYASAYQSRYQAPPVRNAKTNGQVAQIVKRLGSEAPDVARHFVGMNTAWYVQKCHSLDCLLKDAESIRMQWATARNVTAAQARQMDATQTNANTARILKDHFSRKEASENEQRNVIPH